METSTKRQLQLLCRKIISEQWFESPLTRTASRCTEWIMKTHSSGSLQTRDAVSELLAHWVTHHGTPSASVAEGFEWIAVQVLAGSALSPVERVDNLETAEQLLTALHDGGHLQVISEVTQGYNTPDIRRVMDTAPGGLAFLDSIGVAGLRQQLGRSLSCNREILGHPLLVGKLDEKYKAGVLASVNTVLFGLDRNAASMIPAIIASDLTPEERDAVLEVQVRSCGLYQAGALWAPTAERFAAAVVNYADKAANDLPTEQAAFLQALVVATATLRQKGQGSQAHVLSRQLSVFAYEQALEFTNLAAGCFTAEENARRISDALGAECTKDVVKPLQAVLPYGVQVSAPSGPRHYNRNSEADALTVKEAAALIGDLVDGDVLPSRVLLGANAPRIEAAYGKSWSDIADAMVKYQGFRRPSSSANEVYLKELVDEAFIGQINDIEMEWSEAALMGKQRADIYVELNDELGGEILFEADGHGHFEEIANWDLAKAQAGDRSKNSAVAAAASGGRTISMVALHHDLLTGKADNLIDASSLKVVADTVRARRLPCVFIRRNGSDEMRSSDGGTRRIRLKGLDSRFEAYALV